MDMPARDGPAKRGSGGCEGTAPKKLRLSNTERLAASRERNRMHARRTRERKKARLLDLQERWAVLQLEEQTLASRVEECDLAKLLLCLGTNVSPTTSDATSAEDRSSASAGDDASDADSNHFDDEDDSGVDLEDASATRAVGLTPVLPASDRERLRRERNRLHARKTRLRKKMVFEALERKVRLCERRVARLKALLAESAGMVALRATCGSPDSAATTTSAAAAPTPPDLVGTLVCAADTLETEDWEDNERAPSEDGGEGAELVASCAALDIKGSPRAYSSQAAAPAPWLYSAAAAAAERPTLRALAAF